MCFWLEAQHRSPSTSSKDVQQAVKMNQPWVIVEVLLELIETIISG